MTSILLFLSLLLHIVTLTIVFKLFRHIQALQQYNVDDVNELLETYLQDIKYENRKLEKAMTAEGEAADPAEDVAAPDIPADDATDEVALSLEARIRQLYSQGIDTSEIARRLQCGQREAELILKMTHKGYNNP